MEHFVKTRFELKDIEIGDFLYDRIIETVSEILVIGDQIKDNKPGRYRQLVLKNYIDGLIYIVNVSDEEDSIYCSRFANDRFSFLFKQKKEPVKIPEPVDTYPRPWQYPSMPTGPIEIIYTPQIIEPMNFPTTAPKWTYDTTTPDIPLNWFYNQCQKKD